MSQDIPKTTKQWVVAGLNGFDSLNYTEAPIPKVGDTEVLVELHAASLNFRDLIIPQGKYPFPIKEDVIPGSDGAGLVIATGSKVHRFKPGDKVVTLFNQRHIGGPMTPTVMASGLGGAMDGVLRSYGAFDENGLVKLPEGLNYMEGATLPCAALTAWNALYGVSDSKLIPGQWVLTQGTGGVSIWAVQFAKAAGARVIATTSSPEKAKLLERLGADHIINYKEVADWGTKAKELTGGVGCDHIIEVAGPTSMKQSLEAIKIGGVISIIGFVAGAAKEQPGFLDCLMKLCTARGILVGDRGMMEDMCQAIESNLEKLRPVIDDKTFSLDQLKEAYEYQFSGQHQGKVCIKIA